ncbi:hypothetical protein ABT095_15690 [Kitasatospora sp. NPDC002227]|uniref:hypothetical protein n=1 Tax=Kitasatospora sp. NPDC002227 TaxID=3154773 RepID=UPI0033255025
MTARRMMAVLGAVSVLGLAACEPGGGHPAGPAAAGTVTASAPGSAPSRTAPAPEKTQTAGDAPGMDCTPPALAEGDHVVIPTARPTQGIMFAWPASFRCDPGGGHYKENGRKLTYLFAPDAKAQLVTDTGEYRSVLIGDLWTHIGDCLDGGANVQPPLSCSTYPGYEIAVNTKGEITAIKELWHS